MRENDTNIKILFFEQGSLSFGIFEAEVDRILRYRRESIEALWESPFAKRYALKSFNDYFDIPHTNGINEYFLIKPNNGEAFLVVEGVKRLIKVDETEILPTEADFIKTVKVDDKEIPIFSLPHLLEKDPPLDIHALLVVKQDTQDEEKGSDTIRGSRTIGMRSRQKKRKSKKAPKRKEAVSSAETTAHVDDKRKSQKRRKYDYSTFFSVLLFGASLFVLVYLLLWYDTKDLTRIVDALNFQKELYARGGESYVTSYLSQNAREVSLKDVYHILQEKKNELARIENEISQLEHHKEQFLSSMEEKRSQFKENISSAGIPNINSKLKTAVYLTRHTLQFDREIKKRSELYMVSYEQRSDILSSERERYRNEIDELTDFVKEVSSQEQKSESLSYLFLNETKLRQMKRFLFLIERNEYGRAAKVLTDLMKITSSKRERAQYSILVQLVSVLKDYRERLNGITKDSPFDDIKMAYLNESYEKALDGINRLQSDGFLRPLLSGLKYGLKRNMDRSGELADDLNLKGETKELFRKAQSLEQRGEYEKALSMYENLLIFNLPPYDREYIIKKIHGIMGHFERNAMKRTDNTKAIKYLEIAQRLYREGNEEEALSYYKLLITECPNSDYVENALSEIIKIVIEERILG